MLNRLNLSKPGIYIHILSIVLCTVHFTAGAETQCTDTHYIEPICANHPDGYGCKCGPGFSWNQHTCMSTAVDSRLEFSKRIPIRYSLLLDKAFPELKQFTVVLWIRVKNTSYSGTVFSYRSNTLRMTISDVIELSVLGAYHKTEISLVADTWYHLTWTWTASGGKWRLYINGEVGDKGRRLGEGRRITGGGEFVLGQSSRTREFDPQLAFLGDLSHLHIWDRVKIKSEIEAIVNDCTFMYCGNAIQWTDLRSGTRGAMRLRWPSWIFGGVECFSEASSAFTCNKYCSDKIGAQCNKDVVANIVWPRTPANNNMTATMSCPGVDVIAAQNDTTGAVAVRRCVQTADNDGKWMAPHIDECISSSLLYLKKNMVLKMRDHSFTPLTLLSLADDLLDHVTKNTYRNPVDIATVISLLQQLVDKQNETLNGMSIANWKSEEGQAETKESNKYPKLSDTQNFAQTVADVVDTLLHAKNNVAWNATNPQGSEAASLMATLESFSSVIAKSLEYHVTKGLVFVRPAQITVSRPRIGFQITSQWIEDFQGIEFPFHEHETTTTSMSGGKTMAREVITLHSSVLKSYNTSLMPVFIGVSSFLFPGSAWLMPHKTAKSSKNPKEDNVNTAVASLFIHANGHRGIMGNLSQPITLRLPYMNTTNISNPECVRMVQRDSREHWHWSRTGCSLWSDERSTSGSVVCVCYTPGVFAVTTDMYDDLWDKDEKRPILMNATTYVGGSISVFSCLVTCLLLVYLRTASSTAHLHKNLSLAIAASQLCFMVGIDRVETTVVCQTFAILIHYFVLASFSWIMNEAFNLYIVITYSAHSQSHSDMADNSSRVRYYVLGWVAPIVLVGAFVGSEGGHYYSSQMCLIDWQHIWFFAGPILGIIVIIILVLIFTAKEHNENSYTKTEKTNKVILTHMKALWTQVIILTCCWSFAFITVKMTDPLIKYIYAIINFLQGSFFFVFYFLLHDEVRAVFKSHRKKKTLVMQGYDIVGDDASVDSYGSGYNTNFGRDVDEPTSVEMKACGNDPAREYLRQKRSEIEASSDDGSDIEMTVTRV